MRQRKELRMSARFWITRGMAVPARNMGREVALAADIFSSISAEAGVTADYMGKSWWQLLQRVTCYTTQHGHLERRERDFLQRVRNPVERLVSTC